MSAAVVVGPARPAVSGGPLGPRGRTASGRGIAFFDVDETLITAKSMFDFWAYWTSLGHGRDADTRPVRGDRVVRNRAHFRRYAGVPAAELEAAGRRWYAAYRDGPAAFVPSAVEALRRHRDAGRPVVLVSGSMRALTEPVARDLGADAVLCTELRVGADGLLTGEVEHPMIGGAKGAAARELIRGAGAAAADCYGYGDHASDLPLLRAVGHPAVVGGDPDLVDHALRAGWPRLPAGSGPRHFGQGD
ncbi:HAD family hydrolase [Streptomyces sp. NPDC051684]|uniref:HAD family hydrolase n=1 Tax=Streptomyces sp. NPDC051684 TaxID=3365670 RepID=UPI003795EAD6